MRAKREERMSAAARAAVLDGLPDVPCMAKIPWPRATEPNRVTGTRRRRVCVLRNGHGEFDIPCSYSWIEEPAPAEMVGELGSEF